MAFITLQRREIKKQMRFRRALSTSAVTASRGFSMIELLVAVALSSMMLVALVQAFSSNSQNSRLGGDLSAIHDNARTAMRRLNYDIRLAGHWGGVNPDEIAVSAAGSVASVSGCGQAWVINPDQAVFGFDGKATLAATGFTCIDASDYVANSDVLVLRYADASVAVDDADLTKLSPNNASKLYLRATATGSAVLFQGKNAATAFASYPLLNDGNISTYNLEYQTVVYFLRPCSVKSGTTCDDGIPTLVRMKLMPSGTTVRLTQEPLVENVEQLQYSYGVDTNNDLSVDNFLTADLVTDWSQVQTIRVSALVRGEQRDLGYSDPHITGNGYEMVGDMTGANSYVITEQNFHRKLFTQSMLVRNRNSL